MSAPHVAALATLLWWSSACPAEDLISRTGPGVALNKRFVSTVQAACSLPSPLVHVTDDGTKEILLLSNAGVLRAIDPDSGEDRWRFTIEAPEGQSPLAMSTPALIGQRLVIAWTFALTGEGPPDPGRWVKVSHHVQVFDLRTGSWDEDYPRVTLSASEPTWDGAGTVTLDSSKQMMRPRVAYLPDGSGLGLAYVSMGVGGGGQPYHGWVFELDLDAWRSGGADAAISGTLLTTADNDCAYDNEELLFAEVCGGGVWTSAGPTETTDAMGNPELIIPTGNGRVHPGRRSYAHGLLRVGPGLNFDAGCDPDACAGFDETDPSVACLESCAHYFVPRLPPSQTFAPENGHCDGETFQECYGTLDADFGSSAPVAVTLPSGRRVLVQAAKDGAVYLIDREHMGTMLDRLPVIQPCGTKDDRCSATWAGQFVTQPLVWINPDSGETMIIVAGFNFDATHPAGVAGIVINDGPAPMLELVWTAPNFGSDAAITSFRRHPGRPALYEVDGTTFVFVVETFPGRLWVIRAADGAIVAIHDLTSNGIRYSLPVFIDDRVFVAGCGGGAALADGRLEAFDLNAVRDGATLTIPGGTPTEHGDHCQPSGIICAAGEYCERQVCGGPGVCLPRPSSCAAAEPVEVCGCDGATYPSRCQANIEGQHVKQEGACP